MDNSMEEYLYDFTTRLQSISGRNDKEDFIKQYKDVDVVKNFLKYSLNPIISLGIKSTSLKKYLNKTNKERTFTNLFECFEYLTINNTGRDVDIKKVASYIDSLDEHLQDFVFKSVTKTIKLGVTPKTIDKVIGESLFGIFEVQRGKSYHDYRLKVKNKVKSISEKRNGIRCITFVYPDGTIVNKSRQNQVIDGLNLIKNDMKNLKSGVYEGELVVKDSHKYKLREVLQETIKIVNSDSNNKVVNYEIFDYLTFEEFDGDVKSRKFFERRDTNPVNNLVSEHVFMIPELYRGTDENIILNLLDEIVDNGGEGLMCNLDESYKVGKTTAILKVKKKYTSDLRITGFKAGTSTGKYKDTLGSFEVDYKGYSLFVGGIPDEIRHKVWNNKDKYLGVIIEVEHEQETENEKGGLSLEYPNFVDFRFDKDEISYAHD